ncbi:molecular chaperone HtpG [Sulfuriflexus mobilis]|uniref:molecular chaperone HtpG n=1 Tax=Sulfuriflexus mobilis TaxID=1811807 RepID=UPI000F84E225|nr:molecular chaperone HtpG [Sulfuriflexus mobilis]
MTVETHKETLEFQTEVQQLLRLMIHSLYSNKEIFLRELISNASDACDKLRFEALADDALFEGDSALGVSVSFDKEAKTLTIADNGIGMSREEVIDNIGTIAKSGTKQFFESLTGDQASDANLIGQFGVGFYSAFIVADKVTLETRRAGTGSEHGVRWESAGEGDFSLETIERDKHGTTVILHLRDDEDEFLDGFRLRNIIRKYSDHISLPISMPAEGEDKAGELETVNSASALWARSKSEISDEEYNEFYKHVAHDFQDPLCHLHNRVEGKLEYTSLLYVPSKAPFDLWDRDSRHGIKLYVRRVFIMDDAEQLMPQYLRFVRGVIDSADLPLNVSREILQHNKTIDSMRAGSVKKVLGMLEAMAKNDAEKYAGFWGEFGRVMKEGPGEDFANREQIAKLLRFASTHSNTETQDVSLDDYIARMQEGQDKIYYITADSFNAAKNSPHLEIFRKKGIEVLLLAERVDEWLVSSLTEYDGKMLQSVAKGDLDLGALEDQEEKAQQESIEKENADFIARIKASLGEEVKDVRVTHRLTDSPACLVSDANDISGNLERILKSAGQDVPDLKPILEVNPGHALISMLKEQTDEARFNDWVQILFDQALLTEGGQLEDPAAFVQRLNAMLLTLAEK